MPEQPPYVAVVGTGDATAMLAGLAEQVGSELARAGATIVCGGLGGVMEAACRGARSAGGATVGILPGSDRAAANEWVQIVVATGLGELRNGLIIRAVDAVVAIGGSYGTLSEVALALKAEVPVVGLQTWAIDGIEVVADAPTAVARALELAARSRRGS